MDFETLSDEDYSDLSGERKMLERLRQVAEYVAAVEMKVVSPQEDHLYFPEAEMHEAEVSEDQGISLPVAPAKKHPRSQLHRRARLPKKLHKANRDIPKFTPGDTVRVNVRVTEGNRTRVQAYEGVCIARSGVGLDESFTVRKISHGEGVERVFPLYSPLLESIEVVRRGKVRRAKRYYLRSKRSKFARTAEAKNASARSLNDELPSASAAQKAAAQAANDKEKSAEAATKASEATETDG